MQHSREGLYLWGRPGTLNLLKLKSVLKEGSGLTGVATGATIWVIIMPWQFHQKSHGGGIYFRVLFACVPSSHKFTLDSSPYLTSPLFVLVSSQGASISGGLLYPFPAVLTAVVAWPPRLMSTLPTESTGSSETTSLPGLTLCWPPGRNMEWALLLVISNTAEVRLRPWKDFTEGSV